LYSKVSCSIDGCRSTVDMNDDKLASLPSFLEAFVSIIAQLTQVCYSMLLGDLGISVV